MCLLSLSTENKFSLENIKNICISPDLTFENNKTAYVVHDDIYFNYRFIDENHSIDIVMDTVDDELSEFCIFISYEPHPNVDYRLLPEELHNKIHKYIVLS